MAHSVKVTVGADTSPLNAGMAAAKHAVDSFKEHTEESFKELGGELIGAFAVGALLEGLHSIAEEFASIQDKAEKMGVSAETFQRIAYAAKLAGTDAETVGKALEKVNYNVIEAADGSEKLQSAFKELGIDFEAFAEADKEEQIIQLSKAFHEAEGSANELAHAARDTLGKAFAELRPLLSKTPEELKAVFAEANVASNETVANLKENEDKIEKVWMNFKASAASALSGTIDFVQSLYAGLGMIGTYLATLPEGFKAANEAAKDFAEDFEEKHKKKKSEEEHKPTDVKARMEAAENRKAQEEAKKDADELQKLRDENSKKEEENYLARISLLEKQYQLIAKINEFKNKIAATPIDDEKNKGVILDTERELQATNKEIARENERQAKEAFEKQKKAQEKSVKDLLAEKKKALSESEKDLSSLERAADKKTSVDDLRKIGGGITGANYHTAANKDDLIKQQVEHAKQSVELQRRMVAALEKREEQIQSFTGGFN